MSHWSKLVAHDPVARLNQHGNTIRGWFQDIDDVLIPGRKVRREGISATTMHVISVDRERSLVAIMEDGHSVHMNSHDGSRYFSSQIMVFRYRTETVGNEVHVIVPYTALFRFPLKEGAR
jgi:hypothetical protein